MQKSTHTSLVIAILLSASSCFKKAADLKVYKKVGLSKNEKKFKSSVKLWLYVVEISEHAWCSNFKYWLSWNILVSKIYFFATQNSYEKPNSKLPNRSKPAQISDYVS